MRYNLYIENADTGNRTMTNETVADIMNSNIAGRFDISGTEAERIASIAKTGRMSWLRMFSIAVRD